MSDLTAKFSALEIQLEAADAAMQVDLNAMREQLDLINTALDTLNNNGATNTRYLLQALTANDPCGCAGAPTLIVPPVIGTGIAINSEQCQRIQAFLHTMQEIFTVLDASSAFSVGLNFSLLRNSFNEVIGSIESGSDLPVISYPEAVQLVGDMINYIAGNLLVGGDLSTYFAGEIFDLMNGMAYGTSAADMKSLYDGVIDGSALPSYVKPVIKNAAYGALYSYYFDPGTTPNLTGYDGSLCGATLHGVTACTIFNSSLVTNAGHDYDLVQTLPSSSCYGFATEGNFNGYRVRLVSVGTGGGIHIYSWTTGCVQHLLIDMAAGAGPYTFSSPTIAIMIVGDADDSHIHSFSVEICPPE